MLKRGTAAAGVRARRAAAPRASSASGRRRAPTAGARRAAARQSCDRGSAFTVPPFGAGVGRPFPDTLFPTRACVSRRARPGSGACRRRQRGRQRQARPRDPLRARPRGQPGHAGLPDEPARPRRERPLRRGRDRARHARRPLDVDEDDLHGGAEREAAGDRLRLARRRARRVRRRLDRRGGRRARDGADDEHRLVDADRLERREPRLRPAAQGDQRRGRLARPRSPRRTSATRPGRRRPCAGVEPDRAAGAAHARDRPDRADACRRCSTSSTATRRRTPNGPTCCTSPARRSTPRSRASSRAS